MSRSEVIMNTLDLINNKCGPRTIRLAAEGFNKDWSMKRQLKSPNFTTQWQETTHCVCAIVGIEK